MAYLMMTVDIWFVKLGLKISDMSRSFKVFGFEIYFYGCVIALSVLVGLSIACWSRKRPARIRSATSSWWSTRSSSA